MELITKVLQDYCDERNHVLLEDAAGCWIFFNHGFATMSDCFNLVDWTKKYGWHFYLASKDDVGVYALVYENPIPTAN